LVRFDDYARRWQILSASPSSSQMFDMINSIAIAYAILSGHRKITESEYKYLDRLEPYLRNLFESVKLKFPPRPKDIVLPKAIAKQLVPISMKIGESMQIYGFRFFLNTKTLLKSLALMKGRNTVTSKEFNEFLEALPRCATANSLLDSVLYRDPREEWIETVG